MAHLGNYYDYFDFTGKEKFSTIYYPFSTVDNLRLLKLMVLYFDEIHVLVPSEFHPIEFRTESEKDFVFKLEEFNLTTELLRQNGNLKYFFASSLSNSTKLLSGLVESDINDDKFKMIAQETCLHEIEITKEKWYSVAGFQDWDDDTNRENTNWIWQAIGLDEGQDERLMLSKRYKEFPQEDHPYGYTMVVPFTFGASLALSLASLWAEKHNATLTTDNLIYHKLLNRKISRNLTNPKVLSRFEYHSHKITSDELAIQTMSMYLPNLESVSFEDILEIKEKYLTEQLSWFRTSMLAFSKMVKSEPWSDEFQKDLHNVVEVEIGQTILDINTHLSTHKSRFISKILSEIKSAKPIIPLVATIFTQLPIEYAMMASALLTVGSAAYETWLEDHKKITGSGLSFLFAFD